MSRVAGLTSFFGGDDREFQSVASRVERTFGNLQTRARGMVGIIGGSFGSLGVAISAPINAATALVGAGLSAITSGIETSVTAASDAQDAYAKLSAVLRATGNASGFTASQLKDFAAKMQTVTRFEDDATVNALAMLAAFRNIRGDNFTGAAKAAMNLATVTGRDLPSAMELVGRALNDPKRGLSSLQRAGVAFTDQQRKQIAALNELGLSFRAQQLILRQLEKSYGGTAEAAGGTFRGQVTILKNELNDLAETIGNYLLPPLAAVVKHIRANVAIAAQWISNNTAIKRSMDELTFALSNLPDIAKLAFLKLQLAFTEFGDTAKYILTEQIPAYLKVFTAALNTSFTGAGIIAKTAGQGIEGIAEGIGGKLQGLLIGAKVAAGVVAGNIGNTISGLKTGIGALAGSVGGLQPQKENPQIKALNDQIKSLTDQLKKNYDDATHPTAAKTGNGGMDPFAAFRQMRDNLLDTLTKVSGVAGGAIGKLLEAFWKEAGRRAKLVEPRLGGTSGLAEMHRSIQQAAISDPGKRDPHLVAQEKGNAILNKIADFAERWIKGGAKPIVQ